VTGSTEHASVRSGVVDDVIGPDGMGGAMP